MIVGFFVGTVRDAIVQDFSLYDLSVLYFELQLVDVHDIIRSVTSLAILDLPKSYHPEANANRLPARLKQRTSRSLRKSLTPETNLYPYSVDTQYEYAR